MFRPKSDAIQIGQDSFKIPCRNGTQFTENGIVRFDIPRNAGFVDLANSYLECEILLENPSQSSSAADGVVGNNHQPCLQLDRMAGAQNLINRLTIRSEGRVLEELRNYNTYANIHYNATLTEGAMNRRSRLEGCANSYMIQDNPYNTNNQVIPPVAGPIVAAQGLQAAADCWKPVSRKVCLPLLGGMFTNPRSHPAMVMPLEVEIILEDALRCLRVASNGDLLNSYELDTIDAAGGGAPGAVPRRTLILGNQSVFNTPGGALAGGIVPSNGEVPLEGQQQLNTLNNCPFRVGQQIRVSGGGDIVNAPTFVAGVGVLANIVSIAVLDETYATAGDRGKLCIVVDADMTAGGVGGATNPILHQLGVNDEPLATHGSFGYQINQPRLVIQKVIPPPAVVQQISSAIAKGQYNQDIISYTNVDNAIPSSQTTSTNILSVDLSRVKSILSVPTSQNNTDRVTTSNWIQGQYLNATDYEYQIDNKLQPDRRVSLLREINPPIVETPQDRSIYPWRAGNCAGAFHRFELEKALRSANIGVKNLQFITKNPAQYVTAGVNFDALEPGSWLVGRSLGAGVGTSQNLVAKSCLLYLNYNANSNMTKLLKNFLVHIRTLSVSMNGVSVYY